MTNRQPAFPASSLDKPHVSTSASLPTTRALLTSLLTSLSTIPSSGNSSLPPSARALLTTLHVLIPPPTLLQALDLLDRGCVTRLLPPSISDPPPPPDPDEGDRMKKEKGSDAEMGRGSGVYQVASTSTTRNRGGNTYLVRLGAWNCTCAAWAFSAFPGGVVGDVGSEEGGEGWFGGESLGGEVPVCKHVLASVLAERWEVVGGKVVERALGLGEWVAVLAG